MLSSLYGWVTDLRNWLYDSKKFKTTTFDIFTISVGNLSLGGTGKTPHIEYLVRLLQENHKIATLSRGYGRKTKGVLLANPKSTAQDIGDEPMQFYQKFSPSLVVAVGEERILAVPEILYNFPDRDLLLLDDAFQHRSIGRHLNILLTDFNKPFYEDKPLPFGRLRENRTGAKRADIIIVSKCPSQLNEENQQTILKKIKKYSKENTAIFFSYIKYGQTIAFDLQNKAPISSNICLVTGIANSDTILNYVKTQFGQVEHLSYSDHYFYTLKDKAILLEKAQKMAILTTEKDFVKLKPLFNQTELQTLPLYYLPIEIDFLPTKTASFETLVKDAIEKHRKFDA